MQKLFQQEVFIHADEMPVNRLTSKDIDFYFFSDFCERIYGKELSLEHASLDQLLADMNLLREGNLNLACALLFSKKSQYYLPAFIIKAVAFPGTEITSDTYLDSRDIAGKLTDIYDQAKSFLRNNTRMEQKGQSFNSLGIPEIPDIVWEELLVNALIHRDYFISAPIRLFIFSDRIEIISPGHLPNNLTVENIRRCNSNMRNPVLASFAARLLPYRGTGSGILRALKAWPHIQFVDDREGNLFSAIVKRPA